MAIKVNLKRKIIDIIKSIDELNKKKMLDDQDKKKKEEQVAAFKELARKYVQENKHEQTPFDNFIRPYGSANGVSAAASISEREDEEDSEELWANENFVASSNVQANTDRDFMRSVSERRGQEVIVIDEVLLKDGSIMYKISGGNPDDIKNVMQKIADKMNLNLHVVGKDGNIDFKITSKDDKSLVDMRTFMKAVHDDLTASKHNVAVHPLKTEMVERVREAVKETAKVDVNAAVEHAKPPVKAA
jgi:hypothetical protein